jgi:hypothetical protein
MYTPCFECLRAGQHNGVEFQLNNKGIYKTKCNQGHDVNRIRSEPEHEVIFEVGCHAFIDGYYRDSISSFASALEKFYKFYCQIASAVNGVPDTVFEQSWKLVGLSERQIGAFTMAFTLKEGKPPKLLDPKMVKLRNEVVHQGLIPSASDASTYGRAVIGVIGSAIDLLKEKNIRELLDVAGARIAKNMRESDVRTLSQSPWKGPLSFLDEDPIAQRDLGRFIQDIEEKRSIFGPRRIR